MKYEKLNADIQGDEMKLIDKAVGIEQRTRANFIRLACLERAKRIIKENKQGNKNG